MKLMFNGMEIEGTPEECATFKRLMDNQPAIKFVPIQPYTQPYISPYTINPFKWNELTCNTNDYTYTMTN